MDYMDYFLNQLPKNLATMAALRDELAVRQGALSAAQDAVADRAKAAEELAAAKVTAAEMVAGAKGASYLAISKDGKVIYSTSEVAGGGVAAYRILADGKGQLINAEDTKGKGCTHLSIDPAGHNLLAANYGSGSVACLPIKADGSLAAVSSFDQHVGTAEAGGYRLRERVDIGFVEHVAAHGQQLRIGVLVAQHRFGAREAVVVAAADCNRRPRLQEPFGRCEADAGRTARHHRNLPGQIDLNHRSPKAFRNVCSSSER